MVIHTLVLIVAALIFGGTVVVEQIINEAPRFEAPEVAEVEEVEIENFELKQAQYDPSELTTESLTLSEEIPQAQTAQYNDDSAVFEERGGGTATGTDAGAGLGFNISGLGSGPVLSGGGGVDTGLGTGTKGGRGGSGEGFGGRGSGSREEMLGRFGGTKQTERAVGAALNWIARHQEPDGGWKLNYTKQCKDPSCTGPGNERSETAATALGLLPFLAAGQTHQSKGPYQRHINGGIAFLLRNQKPTGDLSGDAFMYAHGLCTIAMCEAYGMTQDSRLLGPAQAAVNYIESSQDPATGGWWYKFQQPGGDTSVFGWQVMALKSAHMAGLRVNVQKLALAEKWLASVSHGQYKGTFSYRPDGGATPTMTSVGLLTTQYLGAPKGDPRLVEGIDSLMKGLPNIGETNFYYWYYATQVMHNVPGPEWDTWNRAMRRVLVDSQVKSGCATGSWDPKADPFGNQGGRLYVTSLAALTLEVYYRYLPLYKLDKDDKNDDVEKVK